MSLGKLLIVEDSPLLQKGYDLIFQSHRKDGLQIVRAHNGREALELLKVHRDCDLIILDINMPEMSGLEFLENFKNKMPTLVIPTIIVTSEDRDDDIMRGLKAGAKAYLTKPFSVDELLDLIEKLTAKRPATATIHRRNQA